MGLMDAKEYDPRPAQRMWRIVALFAILIVIGGSLLWWYRFWPEERVVNRFLEAIERKDFDAAYGIYFADPDWKQHPAKYGHYPLPQFMRDWGPAGEYGVIATHKTDCAVDPSRRDRSASGIIVVVTVNGRTQTKLWVEKGDKTITLAPDFWEVHCRAVG